MALAPAQRIGWRVQVFWEGEGEWFDGTVLEYAADEGFFVRYDDGEEQWEDAHGETMIKFIAPPASNNDTDDVEEPAMRLPSPGDDDDANDEGGYDDDEYDRDGYDDKDVNGRAAEIAAVAVDKHRSPELNDIGDDDESESDNSDHNNTSKSAASALQPHQSASASLSNQQQQQQRRQQPARNAALIATNAAFFRDDESLRAMRESLRLEKKALAHEHATLAQQLVNRQQHSAQLKRELDTLKTNVTLARVLRHPTASLLAVAPAPQTAADWRERVLDQKLQNKQIRQELAELRASSQRRAHALEQREHECVQLRDKLARVPRRDLCTLVDIQVEIATLLDEKRTLMQSSAATKSRSTTATRRSGATASSSSLADSAVVDAKTALEKELSRLELASVRAKDASRAARLTLERARARILPLQARRIELQQLLRTFETTRVLLRSAFLRLRPDATGRVAKATAAAALLALAPAHAPFTSVDDVMLALKDMRIRTSSNNDADDDATLAFQDFVASFEHLFPVAVRPTTTLTEQSSPRQQR